MNSNDQLDVSQLLSVFVAQSNNGYVILDSLDQVIYANHYYAETLFATSPSSIIGKTFEQYVREAFEEGRGFRVAQDNLENWLQTLQKERWQKTFRSFEIELVDRRWFLISEQIIGSRFLFVHATEITRTKDLEMKLRTSQQQLLQHAYVDDLTNIANRRSFVERASEEISKALRNQKCIDLFIFDIDHFKAVNDRFGHQAGDHILQALCKLVDSQLRDYDIIARIGGEEFAIVFTDGDNSHNLMTVERIRRLVEQTDFTFNGSKINCTLSFGGTSLKTNDRLESLVSRADENLYQAKHLGRNQTVFSEN